MYMRLMEFLETNELFDSEQHGFRPGKSVTTAGIDFIESITDAVDRGDYAAGIFMDLCKAFDSVSHNNLISTLRDLGIIGMPLNWLQSYLKDRKQYVETSFKNKFNQLICINSKLKNILHGVPQGSILGPILFLCYLNGLPQTVKNSGTKMCLYADDSNLIISNKSLQVIEDQAQSDLISVRNYFSNKNLLLNLEKTNFVLFSTRQNKCVDSPKIEIGQVKLNQLDSTKFLGMVLDKNLTWNEHTHAVLNKLSSGLYDLRSISKFCRLDVLKLKLVYFAHIHSHISFGIVLYGATSDQNLQSIPHILKQAIHIMINLEDRESAKQHFQTLGILTVYGLYILDTVVAVRKARDRLPVLGSSHGYLTRNQNQLAVPKLKLEFKRKKPLVAGVKFYNSIPENIKSIPNVKLFRLKLKEYLVDKTLYSFNEFFESSVE
uniref:Reverse transcriptase domain-containing protein n=2 Tax=Homalodisca liturata TaxID=320908 RepID=A0A1B6IAE0_9HEMI